MNSPKLTKEEALKQYRSRLTITAQACWDRWPESTGMYGDLMALGKAAGLTAEQVMKDVDEAPIQCDGGRW